ncbi:MAG: hypothetical protein DCC68_01930 [Planctomycetota bacterium]|nr:MAG: hypothetical protein DCC68_01930 [Planctomycetota bacterium]
MIQESFSIDAAWGISGPCYVRKVDRRSHWTDGAKSIRERVFSADPDEHGVSVYRVQSPEELARIAVALNAKRGSRTEDIFLVAIAVAEVGDIHVEQTDGDTTCEWANSVHHDLLAEREEQIDVMINRMLSLSRAVKKFTRSAMRIAVQSAVCDGCLAAVDNSSSCRFESPCGTEPKSNSNENGA